MQKRSEYNLSKKKQKKRIFIRSMICICLFFILVSTYITLNKWSRHGVNDSEKQFVENSNLEDILSEMKKSSKFSTGIVDKNFIDYYLNKIHFNGTALVVKDGKIVVNKGYGFANQEENIKNNPNTVFYIGSITKSFVATSIMQLAEEGKINVQDPLSKYLPTFPHAKQIRLIHLLTHTSGIPRRNESGGKLSRDELMKSISQSARHLTSLPGTKWNYSDSNYSVLGYVVEKASGVPLHQYIKEHIFKVAGMKNSGFGKALKKETFPSIGYKKVWGLTYTPRMIEFSQIFGCGDIYTTAYDLYKFDHALVNGKLVSQKSYHQIFTPHNRANYGFGWYINRKGWYSGSGNNSNHGVIPGWNSANSFSKNENMYVVLLSNIQNNNKSIGKVNKEIYTFLIDVPKKIIGKS
ncbi:serine hydrolase domain-containing protein [Heyndrickxia sp. NPDC080065]|uniref:serine hydrolase domain-containing protein n=1 Tax=Heyndrickxia sp. NPDC080065 TaxID=3390568 RepID=UPI003D059199